MSDRSKSGMGGGKSKASKTAHHPHSVHIKRADTGGFVVTHHHKHPEMQDSTHVVPDTDQLAQHIDEHMGDQPPAGSPMQPQPAGPAMPPQGM